MVWPGPRVSWPACCLSFRKQMLADRRWAARAAAGRGPVAVAPVVAVREAALAAVGQADLVEVDRADLAEPGPAAVGPAEWAVPECHAPVAASPADQEC